MAGSVFIREPFKRKRPLEHLLSIHSPNIKTTFYNSIAKQKTIKKGLYIFSLFRSKIFYTIYLVIFELLWKMILLYYQENVLNLHVPYLYVTYIKKKTHYISNLMRFLNNLLNLDFDRYNFCSSIKHLNVEL